ncbi:MAG: hypothetical protein JJ878_15710 [Alphaproteobacteria bacterium]|nr:hypothetical protein [Alphaproteobacteria bacterium]
MSGPTVPRIWQQIIWWSVEDNRFIVAPSAWHNVDIDWSRGRVRFEHYSTAPFDVADEGGEREIAIGEDARVLVSELPSPLGASDSIELDLLMAAASIDEANDDGGRDLLLQLIQKGCVTPRFSEFSYHGPSVAAEMGLSPGWPTYRNREAAVKRTGKNALSESRGTNSLTLPIVQRETKLSDAKRHVLECLQHWRASRKPKNLEVFRKTRAEIVRSLLREPTVRTELVRAYEIAPGADLPEKATYAVTKWVKDWQKNNDTPV